MAKDKAPYQSVQSKIAAHQANIDRLLAERDNAPEDQKAGLTEQITEQQRKIRWYQGRQNSAKFAAKAQAETPSEPAEPVAEVATVPETTPDPRNG